MLAGEWYDAADAELLRWRTACHELCRQYNLLSPSSLQERTEILEKMFGRVGADLQIEAPFFCDYGCNIELGDNVFLNAHCVILDEARVVFGNHVFVGPQCGFYTAVHPLDAARRNANLECAKPIVIGDNVWLGGHAVILPGVSVGAGTVIGAGSVVTKDIPPGVVAAGNPCRVLRNIAE